MKVPANRPIERAGVNQARALFEAAGCVFQEVDLGNDYGKDAYVDLVDGQQVTGVCVAVQIKSGDKYRRASGYSIPVEGHAGVWRGSTVPVAGIVHDQRSGQLYWCSISAFLLEHPGDPPTQIPVSAGSVLTPVTLENEFKPFFKAAARERVAATAVLQVCSDREDLRAGALLDCFAAGRSDPRVFVVLRRLLPALTGESLRIALGILAHVTPHPDIFWHESNWVPETVCQVVSPHFRWGRDEVRRLLSEVGWEEWQRGDAGQDLYMLLRQDPAIEVTVERVAVEAMREGDEGAAWAALYLAVYWASDRGRERYDQLVRQEPEFRDLPLAGELEVALREQGYVVLFE